MEDQTFWQEYDDVIGAAITLAITFAIAYIVDRFVLAHAGSVAALRVTETGVSRAAKTRLRVVRRLTFVVIVLIGCFLALNEFTKLDKLATGLLASSAVLGLVLGLAARQVLANPLAGLLLAFTQPIRIGDTISTMKPREGRRPDALLHTLIDPGDGRLMIIPNEHVVTSTVFNHSTGDRQAPPAAAVWLPPAPTSRPRGQRSRRSRRPGSNSRRSRPRGSGHSRPRWPGPHSGRGRGGGAARARAPAAARGGVLARPHEG